MSWCDLSTRPATHNKASDTRTYAYEGMVTRSCARKLQQDLTLSYYTIIIDENEILSKSRTLLLLRFTPSKLVKEVVSDIDTVPKTTLTNIFLL